MKIKIVACDNQVSEVRKIEKKVLNFSERQRVDIDFVSYFIGENLLIDIYDGRICPDILFMGIELSDKDGTKIAKKLRASGYKGKIIFFTTSEEYYQDAFDVQAYHYILKEKTPEKRFNMILKHSIDEVIEEEREYIILSRQGEFKKIPLDDIQYFEVYGRVVLVHYGEDKIFEFYSQLIHLENKLVGHGFIRIHKSYLVNIRYVDDVNAKKVILVNGVTLTVGRAYYAQIKEAMSALQLPVKFREMKEALDTQVASR